MASRKWPIYEPYFVFIFLGLNLCLRVLPLGKNSLSPKNSRLDSTAGERDFEERIARVSEDHKQQRYCLKNLCHGKFYMFYCIYITLFD